MIPATIGVEDIVVAEMVECAPAPEPDQRVPLPEAPDCGDPVRTAAEATVEQTGAGPPPDAVQVVARPASASPLTPSEQRSPGQRGSTRPAEACLSGDTR